MSRRFGDRPQLELFRHPDDMGDHRGLDGFMFQFCNIAAIDLEIGAMELLQLIQVGIARTEVIDRNGQAGFAYLVQAVLAADFIQVFLLSDLQGKRKTGLANGIHPDDVIDGAGNNVGRKNIDADP